tara:strand:- start:4564 stop:6357 length:1794 start_codon:yes stop_codon:yes gene_type:complete
MARGVNLRLGADITDFEAKMQKASKSFKKTGAALKKTGKAMTMGLTAPLLAFAGASVKAFDTQAKAEAKLNSALKGNEKAFKNLKSAAQEFQKVSTFGDEEIIEQQAYLASLGMTEEQINSVIAASMDLASGTGQTLEFGVKNLAKTFSGLTGELGESIPALKDLTTEQLKSGEAVDVVAEAFKGQALAAAKAGAGGLKQLQNKFGDLMETIGAMLMPILNTLVDGINGMLDAWNGLDEGLQIAIIAFAGILAAIGPVLTIVGVLTTAIGFMLSPVGLIIAAIAALTAAFIYAYDNLDALKEVGAMVFATLQNAVISFIQFLVQNNPFALLIEGYNFVAEAFGKDKITFFDDVSDSLEGLKMKIPEVSTEFGSFGEAVSNAATTAKEALFGVGEAAGVGAELLGGQGGESTGGSSSGGGSTGGGGTATGGGDSGGGGGLIEKMQTLTEASKEFGLSMANDFAGGLANAVTSGENFFKSMSTIFADLLKQIAALIIKAAILAALFAMIPGMGGAGVATGFKDILTGSLTGRASGGSVVAGQPYMVGESGAEMFVPNNSGSIVANNNLGGSVIPDVRISGSDLMLVFNRENKRRNGVNR